MEYTILLAEDQAKLRNVVRNYFVDHGVGCDLARDGAKAQYLEEDVDLARLVRETFERMTVPMNERGLMVKLDLWPISVKGDSARLTQAIDNLAVNVLCHAGAGLVGVRLYQEKGRAVLTVENPCRPIPEDALKHLWDPFYKVDASRSDTGSGLGLAVVKNVVTLHGGICGVRAEADRIEFRIELPVETG